MKTKILIAVVGVLIIATGFTQFDFSNDTQFEKIKIASCPTFQQELERLKTDEKYQIIKTDSTSQSVELLKNGQAEVIMAGRKLKPDEPDYDFKIIREGYSFLSDKEINVRVSELKNYEIYTDLNIEEIRGKSEDEIPAKNITETEDVYQYLEGNIIITSWESTDYNKGKIVHVMENDGRRFELSRQPMLYCATSCEKESIKNLINELKKS